MRVGILLMVLQYALCVVIQYSWPFGTYKAVVRVPFLPAQEIIVITRKKRKADIILSGAINVKESFKYDRSEEDERVWNVEFGEELIHILKLCHCKLKNFDFDIEQNIASVWLSMPVIGSKKITLRKV